jgi:histidinol dehydrogenase
MQTVLWSSLSQAQQDELLERPSISNSAAISATVYDVIGAVRSEGDAALKRYTSQFDGVELSDIAISQDELNRAGENLSDEFKQAIRTAAANIRLFHEAQKPQTVCVETMPGVTCEMRHSAINRVGLYVPGGTAPLPSTVMMLAIPAAIAGCQKVVLCSPPPIAEEILYTAKQCGVDAIYACGGAQAIAAMAYGTDSVAKVDKIFGPGNAFVTEAKRQVSMDFRGAAMDIPAGPSEVLVLADETANAAFVAADLLSQAEHGPDSQVVLVTTDAALAEMVTEELGRQTALLTRKAIAEKALGNSQVIICNSLDQAITVSNQYGPEHLIIQTQDPRALLPRLDNAGSIFLGQWTPESVGDYASGTNHTLPTYGYTRTYSSLGTADFMKRYTVQELTQDGLTTLAKSVIPIANAEGLDAHRRAVTLRLGEEK